MSTLRSLAILALVASCGHKAAPTSEWCMTYVNQLRSRATADIDWMKQNETSRRHGTEELLSMVQSDPAIEVAFKACSDADDDDADHVAARRLSLHDWQAKISAYVFQHSNAALDDQQAKELAQLVEQLVEAYTEPAPH